MLSLLQYLKSFIAVTNYVVQSIAPLAITTGFQNFHNRHLFVAVRLRKITVTTGSCSKFKVPNLFEIGLCIRWLDSPQPANVIK